MRKILFLFICLRSLFSTEEHSLRQIFAHLKIRDSESAIQVAKESLKTYPDSTSLRLAYIQALAAKGDETAVFDQWSMARDAFQKDRAALEVLAWSVLSKGALSSQVHIHLSSLVGATLTRDIRAIPIVVSAMRNSNALLRLFGVKFAAALGDTVLQEEIATLFKEERVWFVKQEVIRAIGQLRMVAFKPNLMQIVEDSHAMAEEKAEAILAFVRMYDSPSVSDVKKFHASPRAGLRQLGCELMSYYQLDVDITTLFTDPSPDVRLKAIRTIAFLQKTLDAKTLKQLVVDSNPQVAMTAAWVACHQGHLFGLTVLEKWILDTRPDHRYLAAALLTRAGPLADPVIQNHLDSHEDPFVRVNLAWGLLEQRLEAEKACQEIDAFLARSQAGQLMWDEIGSVRLITPSKTFHMQHVQNYPMIVDQLTRLDLLNLLCILKYPKAQESIKRFIKKGHWHITGSAGHILLEEGDAEAAKVVRLLLKDPDPHLRVQAALMLAMYGRDPAATRVLQEAYPSVDREMKMQILEALGHIGTPETVPFLVDILGQPFQLLRVIAASTLIQYLYLGSYVVK